MIERIGILGGGQLGRMLTLEAKRMGYHVTVLEPVPESPCGQVADAQIVAPYDDPAALAELARESHVVTYEFENIPLEAVRRLERHKALVLPSAEVLRVTQDRILEKSFVRDAGCATAPFAPVTDEASLEAAFETIGFPAVAKTARGGYDGKGQWVLHEPAHAAAALQASAGVPLIVERFVPFDLEISVIAARGSDGTIVTFPVTENVHDHGVLATTIAPARVPLEIAARARAIARTIGKRLDIVGTYCVEFFVAGEDVLVNEIAPRVHNSGHYSLDAMQISQYEAHVRAICGLPLVEPKLFEPAVMVNVLGAGTGDRLGGVETLLRDPDVKLHVYGKQHAALRRKMAHFTVLAPTVREALAKAEQGRAALFWA